MGTIDDALYEGTEEMFVVLSNPSGAIIADPSGQGTILDNDSPPVEDPEIAITDFYSDGTDLKIAYTVAGTVSEFTIAVLTSPDGQALGVELEIAAGDTAPGSHVLTIAPTFDDLVEDYYLIAVVDYGQAVAEASEANNQARYNGGLFVAEEAGSGKSIVHVHGIDEPDLARAWTAGEQVLWVMLARRLPAPTAEVGPPPYYDYDGDFMLTAADSQAAAFNLANSTHEWQNPVDRRDVNDDTAVSPIDALLILNYLHFWGGTTFLPDAPTPIDGIFLDVNGDNVLSELDARMVIEVLTPNPPSDPPEPDVYPWRNWDLPLDIDGSGTVTATDESLLAAAVPRGYPSLRNLIYEQVSTSL